MPRFNTTIEDYSPTIIYSGAWSSGSSSNDPQASLYSGSSFTLTQSDGATASFQFTGTRCSIFGALRQNHGSYQVTVDGTAFPPMEGQLDPPKFQTALFNSPLLSEGEHNVVLINQGNTFVDIDFITWESSIGEDDEALIVQTVQDTDLSFVYTPANVWGTNVPNVGTYLGSSGHGTATPGATLTYTFTTCRASLSSYLVIAKITVSPGVGVSLYGPVGPGNSPFSVTLDNGSPVNHTANKQSYQSQVLLYTAMDLSPGSHVVKVAYEPSIANQIFAIDYANVYTTPSLKASASTSRSRGLSMGAVAGIIISLFFILFILIALALFIRRRRLIQARKARPAFESPMVQSATRDVVYPAPTQWYPAPNSVSNGSDYSSENLVVNMQYAPTAPSEYSEESPTSHYGASRAAAPSSNWQQSGTGPLPVKGQAVPAFPPAAYQSLEHVPTSELRANRRVVPGREQDFGTAPPDYRL